MLGQRAEAEFNGGHASPSLTSGVLWGGTEPPKSPPGFALKKKSGSGSSGSTPPQLWMPLAVVNAASKSA